MKNKLRYVLLAMAVSLSIVACGKVNDSEISSEKKNVKEEKVKEKDEAKDDIGGGNWSSMYGGNYARILCKDFGMKEHVAIDIGAVLEDYSCDVNEVYEVKEDGEYGFYISYKDNADNIWEDQHLIMSDGDQGFWLVEDKDELSEYLDDQIVFIKQYSNWAEGYQYSATYVTANGNEYSYSYYGGYETEPYTLEDVLNFPKDEVEKTLSQEEMKRLVTLLENTGDIQFVKEDYACDFGQYSVYGVKYDEQDNAQFILLGTFGDIHEIPKDKSARKICNFFDVNWN